jgi:hypothetical protein
MQSIKISSKVDEDTWNELKALAAETHQNLSGLLTEAIREYLTRRRVRPVVMRHLEQSIGEKEARHMLACDGLDIPLQQAMQAQDKLMKVLGRNPKNSAYDTLSMHCAAPWSTRWKTARSDSRFNMPDSGRRLGIKIQAEQRRSDQSPGRIAHPMMDFPSVTN